MKIYILNNSNQVIKNIHNAKMNNSKNINSNEIENDAIIIKYDSDKLDQNFVALYAVYKIKL